MLWSILKFIVRISLGSYFKRIDVIGKERLESQRAIFVSNHPGAMMDPLLLAISTKQKLHFIAGAEWFGGGFKSWFFRNQFNMIPVYRPWLAKGDKPKSNEDMFRACYESLRLNKRILIYPEASSKTVPWVRPLKTGAARIKLGADHFIADGSPVQIVPVGMNYVNPHRFQTRVTIVVGEPIEFDLIELQGLEDKEKAEAMTDKIKTAMQKTVLHVENEAHYPIIKQVFKLLTTDVSRVFEDEYSTAEAEFRAKKAIIAAAEQLKSTNDAGIHRLEADIETYIKGYESLKLRRFNPFEGSFGYVIWMLIVLTVFLPVFLVGVLVNGLPFIMARFLFRSILLEKVSGEDKDGEINPAFAGSLAYIVGLLLFSVWYGLFSVLLSLKVEWWVSIPLAIALGLISGTLSLHYVRWMNRFIAMIRWWKLDGKTRKELLNKRSSILDRLNALKSKFDLRD